MLFLRGFFFKPTERAYVLQKLVLDFLNDDDDELWCHGVVVITIAQLHSAKPELWFSKG